MKGNVCVWFERKKCVANKNSLLQKKHKTLQIECLFFYD